MKVTLRDSIAPDGTHYFRSLTVGREYEVLGRECDWFRLLNDADEPVLYDPACFDVTDPSEPDHWLFHHRDEEERYAYPPEWSRPGFFEDYFDKVDEARKTFDESVHRLYPGARRGKEP